VKIHVRIRQRLHAGPGMEVLHAEGNTLLVNKGTAGTGGTLTQAEFDAMLANAWTLIATEISAGALNTAVFDVSTFGAQDYIDTTYGQETVEVCGIGSITVLTV
jgi:hypothetical protein